MSNKPANLPEQRWNIIFDKELRQVTCEPNEQAIHGHISRIQKRIMEMIRYRELEIQFTTMPLEMLQQMHEVLVRELDKRMKT